MNSNRKKAIYQLHVNGEGKNACRSRLTHEDEVALVTQLPDDS